MATLSPSRQVTLPKELCERLSFRPGDQLTFFAEQGRIVIVKRAQDTSLGVLRHLKADEKYTDEESLQSTLANRHRITPRL
jgi:AbrB family looped-hinge helix DNA binding protein